MIIIENEPYIKKSFVKIVKLLFELSNAIKLGSELPLLKSAIYYMLLVQLIGVHVISKNVIT